MSSPKGWKPRRKPGASRASSARRPKGRPLPSRFRRTSSPCYRASHVDVSPAMDNAPLDQRLLEHVRAARLFPEPGTAILAVSGGPDSLALLDLFHAIAPDITLTLVVAHVDHGILSDSAGVADRVVAIGAGYHLPVEVERGRLGAAAGETRARPARYAALRRVQRRVAPGYLVPAHHAGDQ